MKTVNCQSRAHRRVALAAATLLLPLAVHGATTPVGCAPDQLRAAINTANGSAGADVLQLAPACTYAFTVTDNVWYGPNALPPITSDITIEGNGATLLVPDTDSSNAPILRLRFFYVSGGLTPARGTATAIGAGKLRSTI